MESDLNFLSVDAAQRIKRLEGQLLAAAALAKYRRDVKLITGLYFTVG